VLQQASGLAQNLDNDEDENKLRIRLSDTESSAKFSKMIIRRNEFISKTCHASMECSLCLALAMASPQEVTS
jgi:hypothetical protein